MPNLHHQYRHLLLPDLRDSTIVADPVDPMCAVSLSLHRLTQKVRVICRRNPLIQKSQDALSYLAIKAVKIV